LGWLRVWVRVRMRASAAPAAVQQRHMPLIWKQPPPG